MGWRPAAVAWPLLILALAGCLVEPAPRTPAPPTATPTPRPTPTPTPQPIRIAFPTIGPTSTPAPTPPPTPMPTPTPTPVAELRDAGQLLYVGSLDGRPGIVAINADGGDPWLVVEGNYQAVSWSPDGRRFAALGSTGGPPNQVDLFDADANLIRRYRFRSIAGVAMAWSPDGRRVAVAATGAPEENMGNLGQPGTWLLDERGAAEISLGTQTLPWRWSPDGRLAVTVQDDADGDDRITAADRQELWVVDPAAVPGRNLRRLAEGQYRPIGWSPDGAILYSLADFRPLRVPGGTGFTGPSRLLAFDTRSGAERVVATVEDLAGRLGADASSPPLQSFGEVVPAPGGDRFAAWLITGPNPERVGNRLVILDAGGRLLARDYQLVDGYATVTSWSPDGGLLAYTSGGMGARNGLRVLKVAADGGLLDQYVIHDTGVFRPQWSPDGRWLALVRDSHLEITGGRLPSRSWTLRSGSVSPVSPPAWWPGGAP